MPSSSPAAPRPTEDLFTWPLSLFSSLSVFCKFLHSCMQIGPLKPLSTVASWWCREKNDGFVGDGSHVSRNSKRHYCVAIARE